MLDLSLRFTWDELEDVIKGFERRLSELYEYWCYFKIIRILEDITGDRVDPSEIFELIEVVGSGTYEQVLKVIYIYFIFYFLSLDIVPKRIVILKQVSWP